MRLKKERVKRAKKLGNLTVIADKVNIVSPTGKVGGLQMGAGVQAPRRQYQFSYNLDQDAPSVTSAGDSIPPPTGPPSEPVNPVGNALGRIGGLLGQAAWAYAGQALFNRAVGDVSNWMFNDRADPNTPSDWPGIEPVPSPTDDWPGIEPVPSPTSGSPASIYTLAGSELAQHEAAIRRGPVPPPIDTNLRGSPTDVFYTPTSGTDEFFTPSSGASPQPGVWQPPYQQYTPVVNAQSPTSSDSSLGDYGTGLGFRYGRAGFIVNPLDLSGMTPRFGMGNQIDTSGMDPRMARGLTRRLLPPAISTENLPSRARYPASRQLPGDQWIPSRRSARTLPSSSAGRSPPTTNIGTQTANDAGISIQTSTGSPSRQSVGTGTDLVRSVNMGSSPISSQMNTVGTSTEPVGLASKNTGTEMVSMTTSGTSPIAEKIMNDVGIDVSPTLTAALGEQFAEPVRAEMRQLVDEHASFVSRTQADVERLMEIHEALAELYQQSQAELSTQTGYTTAMAQYVAEFADIVLGHQNWRSAINQELPISDQVGTILNGLIAVDPGLRNYFKRLFNFTDRLYEISHSDMQTVNAQMMSTGTSPIGRSTMDSSTSPLGPQPGIWPGHMDRGTDPASPLSRVLNSPTISLPPSPMIPRARSRPGAISTAGMSARSGLMSAYRNVRGRGEIVNRYTGDDWIPQTRTRRRVREYDQSEERPARRGRR